MGDVDEVILMTDGGEVAEGTQSNFFAVHVRGLCVWQKVL